MTAARFTVTGRVQGVWFRGWTEGVAKGLGVTGWVRNRADGRVEGHVEGAEEPVHAFLSRLREGPPAARVDDVEIEATDALGCATFEIRP